MDTGKKKSMAAVICIFLIFVTFASLFYVAREEDHNCTGKDCPICACMHQAEQALKTLGDGFAEAVVSLAVLIMAISLIAGDFSNLVWKSLITQKVQMNN